jgi:hypothetical protein
MFPTDARARARVYVCAARCDAHTAVNEDHCGLVWVPVVRPQMPSAPSAR